MGSNTHSRWAFLSLGRTGGAVLLFSSALLGTTQCVLPHYSYPQDASGGDSNDGSGTGASAGFGGDDATGGNGAGTGGSPQQCQNCGPTQGCVNGTCVEQGCEPGEFFCSGAAVHECDSDGLGSTEVESCEEGEYCDTETTTCEEGVCAPDQATCVDNIARLCDSEGAGFVSDVATDCSDMGRTCVSGSCQGACAPNQTQCSQNGLQTCNASGQYGAAVPCENMACLGNPGNASCQGECAPDQTRCAGNGLETCDENGTYGTAVPCEDDDQTCVGPEGSASCQGECAPDQTQCAGNNLETCDADGQYGSGEACENSTCLGDPGDANCEGVCAPGQEQCFGNGVAECDDTDGQYGTVTACPATTPYCADATCGAPPSCQGGLLATCGSLANESCCTSLIVGGDTYNRINDAMYPATVSDFRLDKFEVTVGRWRKFVAAWNAGWRPDDEGGKHVHLNNGDGLENSQSDGGFESGWDSSWNGNVDTSDTARSVGGTYATWTADPMSNETRPINYVNWYESYAFCIWDGGFLPSEAEWNYAAAGGTLQRQYPWGPETPTCTLANFFNGSSCFPSTYTSNVGVTTGTGVYSHEDLAGNLSEWNLDWHEVTATAFLADCEDCAYLPGSATGREYRGGGFTGTATGLPTTVRGGTSPTGRYNSTGMRCARAP